MRRALAFVGLGLILGLVACDPTTGRPPPVGTQVPAYSYGIEPVTTKTLGASWRPGCPVGPANLRVVRVWYWGYDGTRRTGPLIVHHSVAHDVGQAFGRLYDARFQVNRIRPVNDYGGSDARSMDANNTSAFNCRRVTNGTSWSEHSYGTAIDINPMQNPYVTSSGTILPPRAGAWVSRPHVPGVIHGGDRVVQAFSEIGWRWGGYWTNPKDYQHFSRSGR